MRIIVGVTGGIAAYKTCELVRLLKKAGHEVRVVMTQGAEAFVTPMTLQALSGNPVHRKLFDLTQEHAMGHIELARWADKVVIAPATAQLMAKLACGMADDLLTTLCLASQAPLFLAPAMNRHMWAHPATRENAAKLSERGASIIGPDAGEQACGDVGEGRMVEPEAIVKHLFPVSRWSSLRVTITAGPTQEPIDPVRVLSNRSSGTMGYALAQAFRDIGASVRLISGPVALAVPEGVEVQHVETTQGMLDAVMEVMPSTDVFIGAAAVCDYRPRHVSSEKIKKHAATMNLELEKNPDILMRVSQNFPECFTVGFALETSALIENARAKLAAKGLDMIVANRVEASLGLSEAAVEVLTPEGQSSFSSRPKAALATDLVEYILMQYVNQKESYLETIDSA